MESCERGGQPFIIACQAAKAGGPAEGTLDHPASGQEDESAFGFWELHSLEAHAVRGGWAGRFFSGVALVGKGDFDWVSGGLLHGLHQRPHLGAFLFVGRCHLPSQEVPERIDRQVAFGTFAPLVSIVAGARPAFGRGLHGAALEEDRCGLALLCRRAAAAGLVNREPSLQSNLP